MELETKSGGGADLSNPVMCIFEILDTSKQCIVKSVCLFRVQLKSQTPVQDPGQIFTSFKYLLN